jgi:steroid delta-isomerase-like uncharacterized protein
MKFFLILSFIFSFFTSNNQTHMAKIPDIERNKAIVLRLYNEILNTGKLDLLREVIADNYAGPRGITGPNGFAATIVPVITAFPDIHWTIEDILAEGDQVMIMWSWKGTNKYSFDGFPATNTIVVHHAISVFELHEGKIAKGWMQSDRLGFYQQIHVLSEDAVKPRVDNHHSS